MVKNVPEDIDYTAHNLSAMTENADTFFNKVEELFLTYGNNPVMDRKYPTIEDARKDLEETMLYLSSRLLVRLSVNSTEIKNEGIQEAFKPIHERLDVILDKLVDESTPIPAPILQRLNLCIEITAHHIH